jgi:hypothetical protein
VLASCGRTFSVFAAALATGRDDIHFPKRLATTRILLEEMHGRQLSVKRFDSSCERGFASCTIPAKSFNLFMRFIYAKKGLSFCSKPEKISSLGVLFEMTSCLGTALVFSYGIWCR